ncbi:MAG: histidinol-phosphatase HisJ family protein [Lachnospiraceae bacterium]|nr:histidinol-phosphatase HisJ family protein [Lachnospiraceae bacterium]
MAILADCHLHSSFSADSDTPMRDMIEAGIRAGLNTMCFTEHNDFNYIDQDDLKAGDWILNVDSYLYELLKYKEEYADRIRLLFGVEIGFQTSCTRENAVLAKSHDFDFIIGSTHLVRGMDPYYPEYFEGRDAEEAYREYFEDELLNIKKNSNFDIYGHLDYVVRYGTDPSKEYDFGRHAELFDEILKTLIDKEKGIELNTGGIKKGMTQFHPCMKVLKRYRELGGEIITIGSDAHKPENVGEYFDRAAEVLKECGFEYYCVFEKRSPEFHKL